VASPLKPQLAGGLLILERSNLILKEINSAFGISVPATRNFFLGNEHVQHHSAHFRDNTLPLTGIVSPKLYSQPRGSELYQFSINKGPLFASHLPQHPLQQTSSASLNIPKMSGGPASQSKFLSRQYIDGVYIPSGLLIVGCLIVKREWLPYAVVIALMLGGWKVYNSRALFHTLGPFEASLAYFFIWLTRTQKYAKSSSPMSSKTSSSKKKP